MRLNINLASQPYEDLRQFLLAWSAGLLALAIFTAALVFAAVRGWQTAQQMRQQIAQERSQLARLQQQHDHDLAILNRPENRQIRERSLFLNTLIHRKQFSWTQVFANLEKIMPGRLHVVAINPQLTDQDEILVHVRVAGDNRDKAIELVRNLEQSKSFRSAEVHAENTITPGPSAPSGGVEFDITALYVPGAQKPAASAKTAAARSGE